MVDAASSGKKAVDDCYPLLFPFLLLLPVVWCYIFDNLQPKTPVTPKEETGASKTLFVGNLPFSVERADVYAFFFLIYACIFQLLMNKNYFILNCPGKISSRMLEKLLMFDLLQMILGSLKDLDMLSLQQQRLLKRLVFATLLVGCFVVMFRSLIVIFCYMPMLLHL